jgi:hypothetical protein
MRASTCGGLRKFLTSSEDVILWFGFMASILRSRKYLSGIVSLLLSTSPNHSSIFVAAFPFSIRIFAIVYLLGGNSGYMPRTNIITSP